MAERSTNTIGELRARFMKDIAQAKLSADTTPEEMEELLELELFLIEKARSPIGSMQQQGLLPPDGASNGLPFAAPTPQMQGTGGVRGVGMGTPVTAVDEMRRMLAQ